MIVRTVTTVMFHIPDEYKQHERFRTDNNMTKWKDHSTTQYWIYTTTQQTELKGEQL